MKPYRFVHVTLDGGASTTTLKDDCAVKKFIAETVFTDHDFLIMTNVRRSQTANKPIEDIE